MKTNVKKGIIASIKTHNTYNNNCSIYISTLWTKLTLQINIAFSSYKRKIYKLILYGNYTIFIRHELSMIS